MRPDLKVISSLVNPGSRVLDLGCGDGAFLRHLRAERGADVLGIEIDPDLVGRCIANNIPVVQWDFGSPLSFLEDDSFDLVILSQTLQETKEPDKLLQEIGRIGKLAIQKLPIGHILQGTGLPLGTENKGGVLMQSIENHKILCHPRPLCDPFTDLLAKALPHSQAVYREKHRGVFSRRESKRANI